MTYRTATILTAALTASLGTAAHAAVSYDQDVTSNAIFGGGNINGSYTVDRANGVELGLRGKLRHNAAGAAENTFNSNGDGTYTFLAGVATGQSAPTGNWSFEWSINSDYDGTSGYKIGDLTYQLMLDTDPGAGTSFVSFDPINNANPSPSQDWWDHSMGDNATAQGDGAEATDDTTYAALLASSNLAQNSWKAHWFFPGYDPTAVGTYDIVLTASDNTGVIASSAIAIQAVPEPGSLALLGLGGLALLRRRRA